VYFGDDYNFFGVNPGGTELWHVDDLEWSTFTAAALNNDGTVVVGSLEHGYGGFGTNQSS